MPLLQQGAVTEATLEGIQTRMDLCAAGFSAIVPGTRQELSRAVAQKDSLPPGLQDRLESLATEFGKRHPTAE